MRSNEIRIGNLVNYLGETKRVLGIDEETVFLKHTISINYLDLDEIEPIPLTEEWLLNMGFVSNILPMKHNELVWYENHVGIKGMLGIVKPWSCIYVHQLQNLYFALTGEELLITCK